MMLMPDFERGHVLEAQQLELLSNRIARLQRRYEAAASGEASVLVRLQNRFAFELATRGGMIYVRRGFVDFGDGNMLMCGDQEWTLLRRAAPCTVWLVVDVEARTATVEVEDLDLSVPSRPGRMRLGYVREDENGVLRCVQLRRGVVRPCAPSRLRGLPSGRICYDDEVAGTPAVTGDVGYMTSGTCSGSPVVVYGSDSRLFYSVYLSYGVFRYGFFFGRLFGRRGVRCLTFHNGC